MDPQVQRMFDLIRAVELLEAQGGMQLAIITAAEDDYRRAKISVLQAIIRGHLTLEVAQQLETAARAYADELAQ